MRCTSCSAGYYSGAGAGRCTACPLGTYSNASGATTCTACPTNREGDVTATSLTGSVGSTAAAQCVCAAAAPRADFPFGYYGRAGEPCYYCQNDRAWHGGY